MGKYEFVAEVSNKQKLKVFFVSLMILTVLFAIFIMFSTFFSEGIQQSLSYQAVKGFFEKDIKKTTPLGIFYLSFFGNLLLVPLPTEIPFFIGLTKGNPFMLSLFLAIAGIIPSQAINYIIGTKFHKIIFTFISTKKIYKVKRWVDNYGPYALFIFNLLPLPSNELVFALGIAKYNVTRLFVSILFGSLIKFLAIWGIVILFF